jgi:excisionase family DNA binding protein
MAALNVQNEYAQWRRADQIRAAEATRYFTLAEVSELTRLPARSLRLYIATGRLRAYNPVGGNAVRIKADDIPALFVQIEAKAVKA